MRWILAASVCMCLVLGDVSSARGAESTSPSVFLGEGTGAYTAAPATPAPQAQPTRSAAPRITVTFVAAPLRDVLFMFSEFAAISIVPGSDVAGVVSADIRDQPWDEALRVILDSQGLAARELESGILRVDDIENLSRREQVEPLEARVFHINYATAADILPAAESLLTDRGTASLVLTTNSVIVMDVPRVLAQVETLVQELDIRTPQITISARIIFVNRTGLEELGIAYDLRDSRGEELLFPSDGPDAGQAPDPETAPAGGAGETSGSEPPPEAVNGDMVLLGGSSISALGNAGTRVSNPALSVLTSLILGRHALLAFLEALETLSLSRTEAAPYISVLDNQTARILVGERTPIRVLDAGGGSAGAAGSPRVPTASVDIQETGIVFEVTPHVTEGDNILLDLHAERSFAEFTPAAADAGVIFHTQEAASRVLVQDGETVVIGGLTVTEQIESRSGIPWLMRIPFLGALFRVDRKQQIQRDLIILVTPFIDR